MKNSLSLIGNIGKNIHHGTGQNGSYCFFSLATSRYSYSQKKLHTCWVSCVAYGALADKINRCCSSGKLVGVEAYVKQQKKNKSGVDYYENQVIVNDVFLFDKESQDSLSTPHTAVAPAAPPETDAFSAPVFDDDDIPF